MLLEYFKEYIKISRDASDKTVDHYITGINTINSLLKKYNYPITSVFDVNSIDDLDGILSFLTQNDEFCVKDQNGHNMYSVAFKHFYRFASEDKAFFADNIKDMDIVVAKPQMIITNSSGWQRNQILITQVIDGAHHRCEHNYEHLTFISKVTGQAYMEGHHLIPLKYQNEFSCGIDVYSNIVCLCPVCHRLLHFGTDSEKTYVAEKLFDERKDRLIHSGIDISKNDFLQLVV